MRTWSTPSISDTHAMIVARNLREADRTEVLATFPTDDVEACVRACARASANPFTVFGNDIPVVVGGFVQPWPGVAFSWMVATDAIDQVGVELHRAAVSAHRELAEVGVRRFSCYSLASHAEAHRWLERLGYRREAAFEKYGKHGETFVAFGRIISHQARA
jgi:hypothetical protein